MQKKMTFIKKVCLLSIGLLLTACAGNPPAWWNPSGIYGDTADEVQPSAQPSALARPQAEPEPAEEDIAPVMDDYEEMRLTPLEAQDMVDPAEGRADTLAEQAQEEANADEAYPAMGSDLGTPSVLE